jgi:hypothetical protein
MAKAVESRRPQWLRWIRLLHQVEVLVVSNFLLVEPRLCRLVIPLAVSD